MRLAAFTPAGVRSAGHRTVAVLWVASAAVYLAYLWWFGVYNAEFGFWLWSIAAAPLAFASWSRTRSAALLMLTLALAVTAVALFVPLDEGIVPDLDPSGAGIYVYALVAGLPVFVVHAAVRTLFRAGGVPKSRAAFSLRSAVENLGVIVLCALSSVAWVRAQAVPQPDARAASTLAGCYELTPSRWFAPYMSDRIVPRYVRLDTLAARRTEDDSLNTVPEHALGELFARDHLPLVPSLGVGAYWEPLAGGAVRLIWTTGFHGAAVELRPDDGELRGTADLFSDCCSKAPEPRARVHARRIECHLVDIETKRSQ